MTHPLVVVSTVANPRRQWVEECMLSVALQSLRATHLYIVHGRGYGEALDAAHKFRNAHVLPSWGECSRNLDAVIRALPADAVVCWLDGDDYLTTNMALEHVLSLHKAGAWVTYGQFMFEPAHEIGWAAPYPTDVVLSNSYRAYPWLATHLKTFRAGLYQRLRVEDLKTPEGDWITECVDLAIMWPMLEMAGERQGFIASPIYGYRHDNPASVHNVGGRRLEYQQSEMARLRRMARYQRIERY